MKQYHTIIVGAGPAGLACATHLAKNGKEVLLLERNRQIGPKVCAGGLPSMALSLDFPQDLLEKSFTSQRIFTNWQQATIRDDRPIISTVDRGRLGRWMEQQARAAGVEIRTGAQAVQIEDDQVATGEGHFGYRFLVGADGSSSLVRRTLGIPTERMGVGINYQIPGDFNNMEWHLNTRLFGNGYAWVFPHQDSASIGVYASPNRVRPKMLLASLHTWARNFGIELQSRQPRAARINFDYRGWRFGNRFLVGDAAGLASGLTGEGIYSAIVSGQEVARTILDAKYRAEDLEKLIKKHRRHTRILDIASGSSVSCTMIMETLVLALRAGLFHYRELEMGID